MLIPQFLVTDHFYTDFDVQTNELFSELAIAAIVWEIFAFPIFQGLINLTTTIAPDLLLLRNF